MPLAWLSLSPKTWKLGKKEKQRIKFTGKNHQLNLRENDTVYPSM
jgi:hypothetical protein